MKCERTPVVVVGGGVAGMVTALALAPTPVRLLCRANDAGDTASVLAQGGIAAAIDAFDSPARHARDTLIAGAWHNDATMVHWLCTQAPVAIKWLQAKGVGFDRDISGHLQLGREGGHRAARIVHADGDATGAVLVRTLRQRVQEAPHIQWCGEVDVGALLVREGNVCGVRTRDLQGNEQEIGASAVVLATGGIGALFERSSNPPGADGSGLALGMAVGARIRDLEFVQFHPTALDRVGAQGLPLITEALRGAGAHLLTAAGQRLMTGRHPLGDLGPRDVVARCVWHEYREHGGVWLDATGVKGDWARRFPTVLKACLAEGIDPRLQPIPVSPVAHFHMGGLAVDADGRTSVPGLYAVGEVACNGVHGANRLASNSLLEGVVCGRRLGTALTGLNPSMPRGGAYRWVERGTTLPPRTLQALRVVLWQAAGPERETPRLQQALRTCEAWIKNGWQARLAHALLAAACARERSLGAHYRTDTATSARGAIKKSFIGGSL